jgi:hypothetical protein
VIEVSAKIKGLEDAMKAMLEAFPSEPKKQQAILHSAMGSAARKTLLPTSKQLASSFDASGALSESLAVRAQPASVRRKRNVAASMALMPVRSNRRALALYINHYYTQNGLTAPASLLIRGIMHGHLVEFGSVNNSPTSFLWASAQANRSGYGNRFAIDLKRITEDRVKRAAKR